MLEIALKIIQNHPKSSKIIQNPSSVDSTAPSFHGIHRSSWHLGAGAQDLLETTPATRHGSGGDGEQDENTLREDGYPWFTKLQLVKDFEKGAGCAGSMCHCRNVAISRKLRIRGGLSVKSWLVAPSQVREYPKIQKKLKHNSHPSVDSVEWKYT